MSRHNRLLTNVFNDILPSHKNVGQMHKFLMIDNDDKSDFPIVNISDIPDFIKKYKRTVEDIEDKIMLLSYIEDYIIQLRCFMNVKSEFRFAITRKYIYARTTFFRRSSNIRDIRVLVGSTETLGDNIDELYNNQDLVFKSLILLRKTMMSEINKTKLKLKEYVSIPTTI